MLGLIGSVPVKSVKRMWINLREDKGKLPICLFSLRLDLELLNNPDTSGLVVVLEPSAQRILP